MYDKIEQGKHFKKSASTSTKKIEKKKKEKILTVQQLNVEVKVNQ